MRSGILGNQIIFDGNSLAICAVNPSPISRIVVENFVIDDDGSARPLHKDPAASAVVHRNLRSFDSP